MNEKKIYTYIYINSFPIVLKDITYCSGGAIKNRWKSYFGNIWFYEIRTNKLRWILHKRREITLPRHRISASS